MIIITKCVHHQQNVELLGVGVKLVILKWIINNICEMILIITLISPSRQSDIFVYKFIYLSILEILKKCILLYYYITRQWGMGNRVSYSPSISKLSFYITTFLHIWSTSSISRMYDSFFKDLQKLIRFSNYNEFYFFNYQIFSQLL